MIESEDLQVAEFRPWAARTLETAALGVILAVLAARVCLGEMPFRTSQMVFFESADGVAWVIPQDLFRTAMAMLLLISTAIWAIGQCLRSQAKIIAPAFGAAVLAFAGWTLVSALGAMDKRTALTGWLEMTAILLAAFVTAQLAWRKDRFWIVAAVLAAVAGAIALKGLYQAIDEIPERIRMFEADRAGQLAQQGIADNMPGARMFTKRVHDQAPTGYFGLANILASLLVLTGGAAVGVVVAKFAEARASRHEPRKSGEISLPMLAAVITLAPAALALVVLGLTRSKGAAAAAAIAALLAVIAIAGGKRFVRWRKRLLVAAGAAALGGICAVAAYGIGRGGLPTRSMQVRWEYWQGAAAVVREAPLFGEGAAGFADAYLLHRPPAAAESPKFPHNLPMGAACQFGIVGAALFVAMICWTLATATRAPRRLEEPPPPNVAGGLRWCVALTAAIFIARALWEGSQDPAVVIVQAVLPAAAFGVLLLTALWSGRSLQAPAAGERWLRIAIAAGMVGFVVHNLVTFTLFIPATATAFWVAAGAMAGRSDLKIRNLGRAAAGVLAGACVIGVIAAGVLLYRPVYERTGHLRAAQRAYARGDNAEAIGHIRQAVDADPLDAFPPLNLARMRLVNSRTVQPAPSQERRTAVERELRAAVQAAELAWQRRPNSTSAQRLANALGHLITERDRELEMLAKAVELDPMAARGRIYYAKLLLTTGRIDAAKDQFRRIGEIDSALPLDSDVRLTPVELADVARMETEITRRRQPNE